MTVPKAPEQMRKVIEVLKETREPVTSVEVAERVGTSRQNAYNIIKGRLVPVGLAKVVGRSGTLAELYQWDSDVEARGVTPAARTRAGAQGRTRDSSGDGDDADATHDLKPANPSSLTDTLPTQGARVKVDAGGRIELLEVWGMSREDLLGLTQPLIGKDMRIEQLRIGRGGVLEMDLSVDGVVRTVELRPVA